MTELYDALDDCLDALQRGQALESVLKRYPGLAHQLRPLLVASLMARGSSRLHVPSDVRRRGRARLLQQAAEISEAHGTPRRRMIPTFPRLAITAGLVGALVLTSTGLVSAASSTLPGQQLYPVKRTWESLRLFFVFSPQERDLLESNYEQERLNETHELLGQRLAAPISFSGLLARQSDGKWLISGIPVSVSGSTSLPASPIADGAPVVVTGTTGGNGLVEAHQIRLLQPGSALPPFEPSDTNQEGSGDSTEGPGGPVGPTATATAQLSEPQVLATDAARTSYAFSGVVQSIQGNTWRINGQPVYVEAANVHGDVTLGAIVKFEGYYGADGRFIVTSVESQASLKHGGNGDGSSGGSGGSSGDGSGGDSGSDP